MTTLATSHARVGVGNLDPAPTEATRPAVPPRDPWSWGQLLGPASTVLALLLLAVVLEMAVLGPVRHARAQEVAYTQFRAALANAVAPTGQLDFEGKVVPSGTPVALLDIGVAGLHEVVFQGTSSGVLMDGPGHRRDTPLPGQPGVAVIMGRQAAYGGPFSRIGLLSRGTRFTVTTGQGAMEFKVLGVRHAGDPVPVPQPTQARLTLVTGAGTKFAPSDVVRVDAKLVGPAKASPGLAYGSGALASAEQPLHGDPRVALAVLLWSQLLLLVVVAVTWMRSVWGRWQTWLVAAPVVGAVGLQVAHQIAQFLPNLM